MRIWIDHRGQTWQFNLAMVQIEDGKLKKMDLTEWGGEGQMTLGTLEGHHGLCVTCNLDKPDADGITRTESFLHGDFLAADILRQIAPNLKGKMVDELIMALRARL